MVTMMVMVMAIIMDMIVYNGDGDGGDKKSRHFTPQKYMIK